MTATEFIEDESLIPEEEIIVTLTNKGYIKRLPKDTYRTQNRGGVGIKGITTNEEDIVENVMILNTHDYIMFFTNKGKTYRVKGYEIPEYGRQAKGLPIINLLPIEKDESVNSIIKIANNNENKYLLFATKNGIVKRTKLEEFDNIRTTGKIAITLKDNDELIAVKKTTGESEILLASSIGRMVRFKEKEIREMGRTAIGVKGIQMNPEEYCVGAEIASENECVLVVTSKGYGKRTSISEYRLTHRGSKGVKTLNVTDKNGPIVGFKITEDNKDVIIVSDNGIVIRLATSQIPTMSRVTQGVKLIQLKNNQIVSTVAIVEKEDDDVPRETLEQ
jgi:DNA gyrase subunit A